MRKEFDKNGNPVFYVEDTFCKKSDNEYIPFFTMLADKTAGTVVIDTSSAGCNSPEIILDDKTINRNLHYEVCGTTAVKCLSDIHIECFDHSYISAYNGCSVTAHDYAFVKASDNSTVELYGYSKAEGFNNAFIVAHENAEAITVGNSSINAFDNSIAFNYGSGSVNSKDNAKVINKSKQNNSLASAITDEVEMLIYDLACKQSGEDKAHCLYIGNTLEGADEYISAHYDRSRLKKAIYKDLTEKNGINIQLCIASMESEMKKYEDIISFYRIHNICLDIIDYRSIAITKDYNNNLVLNKEAYERIKPDGDSIIFDKTSKTVMILSFNPDIDMRELPLKEVPVTKGVIKCKQISISEVTKALPEAKNFKSFANKLLAYGKECSSCPYYEEFRKFTILYNPPADYPLPHIRIKNYALQAKEFVEFVDKAFYDDKTLINIIQSAMDKISSHNSTFFGMFPSTSNGLKSMLTVVNDNDEQITEYCFTEYVCSNFPFTESQYDYFAKYYFTDITLKDLLDNNDIKDENHLIKLIKENVNAVKTYIYEENFETIAKFYINPSYGNNKSCVQDVVGNDSFLHFIDEKNIANLILPFKDEE